VLKRDGFALILSPDLSVIARFVCDGREDAVAYESPAGPITQVDMLFVHSASIVSGNLSMAHNTGFAMRGRLLGLRIPLSTAPDNLRIELLQPGALPFSESARSLTSWGRGPLCRRSATSQDELTDAGSLLSDKVIFILANKETSLIRSRGRGAAEL
jgi:hypothetical protein